MLRGFPTSSQPAAFSPASSAAKPSAVEQFAHGCASPGTQRQHTGSCKTPRLMCVDVGFRGERTAAM